MPIKLQLYLQCTVKLRSTGQVATGHKMGITGNFESIIGLFCGNKRIESLEQNLPRPTHQTAGQIQFNFKHHRERHLPLLQ